MNIVITLMLLMAVAPAGPDEITDLLPPDGTPSGWARAGDATLMDAADAATVVEKPEAFLQNGLITAVEQRYSEGSNAIVLRIFEMDDAANANIAFTEAAAGKSVTSDIGNSCVLEDAMILFTSDRYVVEIRGENGGNLNQFMAALAITVDAYLLSN